MTLLEPIAVVRPRPDQRIRRLDPARAPVLPLALAQVTAPTFATMVVELSHPGLLTT
jgi:hypothetical protein